MNQLLSYTKGDRIIWFVVIILSIFSMLAVYSSTGTLVYKYQGGNTEHYLFKHAVTFILSFALMYGAHKIRYTYYSRLSQLALLVAVPLLAVTLIMGTNLNEASRWITLPGTNITFQTSDFAKLALIMYVARTLSKKQDNIKDFKTAFVPIMLPVLIVCGLILPANLSTAAVLFSTCLVLMFIGRVNMKYIFLLLGAGALCLTLFVSVALLSDNPGRVTTWKNRVENFFTQDADGNYQVQHAKMAIATGGILGKGPGHSRERNSLPHPYSDFIFAIIIEEYGLVAAVVIIVLYLTLFFRSIKNIHKNPRAFATLLSVGCGFSLIFQALINMAVAVNLFPVTGQPLPLVSMGGTSILFTGIAIGIILSVSRESENETMEMTPAVQQNQAIQNM